MPSLFTELRRRNVFKVGAAYAIVAWLLIQIADVALPAFGAPPWILQVLIFFMIVGFPITLLMAWAYEMTPEGIKAASSVEPEQRIAPATGQRLNYVILGLVVLAVSFLVTDQYVLDQGIRASVVGTSRSVETMPASAPSPAPVRRAYHHLGATSPISNTALSAHVAVSPDGRRLAYAAAVDGAQQIYVRELDQLETRLLPDTQGAQHPFFSPDGEWVVFFSDDTDQKLKRVAFRGGPTQPLADIGGTGGGFWGSDDRIVYGTNVNGVRSLLRVPATGGTPETLIAPEPNADGGYQWPSALPGGNALLFVIRPGTGGSGAIRDGRIAVLSLESREYRVLIEGAHRPHYVPTGHIAFVRSGALWAVPFDAERLEITGPEVPVLDAVQQNGQIGGAAFAFSDDGLLVYVSGRDATSGAFSSKELVWVDLEGREERLDVEPRLYGNPRLSPDGQRFAISVGNPGGTDIWINDLARNTSSRLTFDPAADFFPLWTPDSERVVFWANRADEDPGLFWRAANGSGQAERLTTNPTAQFPEAFLPDGTQLIFENNGDLHVLSLDSETAPINLTASSFGEDDAAISPDGRWLAYSSNETGRSQIYVREFSNFDVGGKWQISVDGGTEPRWAPDGTELFFRNGEAVLAAGVEGQDAISAGVPRVLFTGNYWINPNSEPNYDLSPDGQRFLMMMPTGLQEQRSDQTLMVAVENWFEELKRLSPPSQ